MWSCSAVWHRLLLITSVIIGQNKLQVGGEVPFKYIGCFTDSDLRLMKGFHQDFPNTLTIQLCLNLCQEKGFRYAGMEYGKECYCDNEDPSFKYFAKDEECSMRCEGDILQLCGGFWKISIFVTGIAGAEVPFKYTGCFTDSPSRLMKGFHQDFPNRLTNQLCSSLCKDKGFRYAGMEYGKECYCDNEDPSFKYFAKDEECSMRCEGDNLQLCGGFWKIGIFETGIDGSRMLYAGDYIGCYKDQESEMALNGHEEHFGNALTQLKCTGLCYSKGYLYAGTQKGTTCYCNDGHPNPNNEVSDVECNKPCPSDPSHICGGEDTNSVFGTGIPDLPSDQNYMACYDDSGNQILKNVKIRFDKTNSPRRCLNYCWQLGFKYSGVEYGLECFCGNEEPISNLIVSGNQCNMPCSGKPTETCGAAWRLAVYSTGVSASVEPVASTNQPTLATPTSSSKVCQHSETTYNGKPACGGDIIFFEEFNSPLGSKWRNVVKITETPDYEFAVFHASPENCFVSKNNLVIKPTVFEDQYVRTGSLALQGCTGIHGTRECGFQAVSNNILPPVASARIDTSDSFFFRYGIVEIRAKLPIGDWLVPELWVEPKNHKYGPNYASGRIRLVMSRGNQQLMCDGKDLGNKYMESGIMMGSEENVRSRSIYSTVPDNWHDQFHTYTLIWKPDSIAFKFDNELQQEIVLQGKTLCDAIGFTSKECALWDSGSKIAPFDTDFYISLGLSAGNARDFPDNCINSGKPKPWRNLEEQALLKFWQDRHNWKNSWSDEKSALYIEYVRVTAL